MTSQHEPEWDSLDSEAYQRGYEDGAAAERERIRQLAVSHNAQYVPDCPDPLCPGASAHMADETTLFADLLTEGDTL